MIEFINQCLNQHPIISLLTLAGCGAAYGLFQVYDMSTLLEYARNMDAQRITSGDSNAPSTGGSRKTGNGGEA